MTAIISPCGKYRYRLERGKGFGSTAVIMVNPSTADAEKDDATIRKLKGFARRNQWGRIIVGNLFAYRSTDVRELATVPDPVGPENDNHLWKIIEEADRVIVAWGRIEKLPKRLRGRYRTLIGICRELGQPMFCIGNPGRDGHPRHPVMLGYDQPILKWTPPL